MINVVGLGNPISHMGFNDLDSAAGLAKLGSWGNTPDVQEEDMRWKSQ